MCSITVLPALCPVSSRFVDTTEKNLKRWIGKICIHFSILNLYELVNFVLVNKCRNVNKIWHRGNWCVFCNLKKYAMWNLKRYANHTTINCWNVFFNEGTKEWTETKILLLGKCWNISITILIVLFLYSCVCVCDWWWIFTLLVLLCRFTMLIHIKHYVGLLWSAFFPLTNQPQ